MSECGGDGLRWYESEEREREKTRFRVEERECKSRWKREGNAFNRERGSDAIVGVGGG